MEHLASHAPAGGPSHPSSSAAADRMEVDGPPPAAPTAAPQHARLRLDAALGSQVDALLGDWTPQTPPSSPPPPPPKRVAISDLSTVYCYNGRRSRGYTKHDRQAFTLNAMSEVLRIKRLVLAAPGATAKDSFAFLLQHHILSMEEVVGLEHLVFGRPPAALLQERRDHAQAVLTEQRRQRQLQQRGSAKTLGEFSAHRSLKNAKKARIRAAMAA